MISAIHHVLGTKCKLIVINIELLWCVAKFLISDQADLLEIPAGIPPPGISPNFINPHTLVPTIIAFSVVMMTWTLSFVMIRLYANFHAPRRLGVDDCKDPLFNPRD